MVCELFCILKAMFVESLFLKLACAIRIFHVFCKLIMPFDWLYVGLLNDFLLTYTKTACTQPVIKSKKSILQKLDNYWRICKNTYELSPINK